jgi:hypothetical protein
LRSVISLFNWPGEHTMIIVEKSELENICVKALNQSSRVRQVRTVKLIWKSTRSAEWMLREVEPRFDILDIKNSLAVIHELQEKYRMIPTSDPRTESGALRVLKHHSPHLSISSVCGRRRTRERA